MWESHSAIEKEEKKVLKMYLVRWTLRELLTVELTQTADVREKAHWTM